MAGRPPTVAWLGRHATARHGTHAHDKDDDGSRAARFSLARTGRTHATFRVTLTDGQQREEKKIRRAREGTELTGQEEAIPREESEPSITKK